ncbi:MAG: (2Fe-2S)-binding protein [Dehalococcoidia bacterium]
MKRAISLRVNDRNHLLEVHTHHTLLRVLRDQLKLYGARDGCAIGMCGACTVLIDGQPKSSCLMLAAQAEGKSILTVEGLAANGALHPIQQAYFERNAFQCSYCTPGFILSTKALLDENPNATQDEIREYLAGNLCRCGSYIKILEAVKLAQERLAKREGR